ncbi:MAG TPA: hypothetical protein VK066_20690 [Chloroflexota bacterium]|nr:hypothetical protein [Chloroflexota bacterium]
MPTGSQRLRAALRRYRRPAPPRAPRRWWPQLTPTQTSGAIGLGITLVLALYDQIRKRLGQP